MTENRQLRRAAPVQAAAFGRREWFREAMLFRNVLRVGAESSLAAAEDLAGNGQKSAGAAVPFGHAVEAEGGG